MSKKPPKRTFKELDKLERIIETFGDQARTKVVDYVHYQRRKFPLYSIEIGSKNPKDPVFALIGGVHGLEKIGSEVVMSYLQTVQELMTWDESFIQRLQKTRMIFIPLINPVGVFLSRRANGNGVDLMRNAPIESEIQTNRIYSGHRISSLLPFFRGPGHRLEVESEALCRVMREDVFPSDVSVAVDVHSGFGARDRFWFPHATTDKPCPLISEIFAFKELFERSYPNHFYQIEPVSSQYVIHGDLWDYLFKEKLDSEESPYFFPWTLEMGSWLWLRKNPSQIFSRLGLYHPIKRHRHKRILRRHWTLFDFIHRALLAQDRWITQSEEKKRQQKNEAMELWYAS